MFILNNERKMIVNVDQVSAIFVENNSNICKNYPGVILANIAGLEEWYILGGYSTLKRAQKVLRLIYEATGKCAATYEMPPDNNELDGTEGLMHQHCEQCYRRKDNNCPYRWQYRPENCKEWEIPF